MKGQIVFPLTLRKVKEWSESCSGALKNQKSRLNQLMSFFNLQLAIALLHLHPSHHHILSTTLRIKPQGKKKEKNYTPDTQLTSFLLLVIEIRTSNNHGEGCHWGDKAQVHVPKAKIFGL